MVCFDLMRLCGAGECVDSGLDCVLVVVIMALRVICLWQCGMWLGNHVRVMLVVGVCIIGVRYF